MSAFIHPTRVAVLLVAIFMLVPGLTVTAQEGITPGTPVEGTYTGDPQVYTLDAARGQLLVISMESEEFDSVVRVAQGEMELASNDDGGEGRNALLAYVVQADGTYDIVADAFFFDLDQGTYTLTVSVLDPPVVAVDGSVTLEPAAEGSARLYTVFENSAGSVVDVWASTMGDEDIEVTLYGVDAATIESDDDDGPGDNALLRRVVLPGDGLYLVEVAHTFSDDPVTQPVEVTVNSTEQLFLTPEPQELILGDGEGQIGTEVYTIDVTSGTTYTFFMTIESMPDEDVGVSLELLDTNFFFEPVLETRHMTAVAWEWLSNTDGQIRLDIHPNFFGTDIEVIQYTISMEVSE